jgi:hypothetical protein
MRPFLIGMRPFLISKMPFLSFPDRPRDRDPPAALPNDDPGLRPAAQAGPARRIKQVGLRPPPLTSRLIPARAACLSCPHTGRVRPVPVHRHAADHSSPRSASTPSGAAGPSSCAAAPPVCAAGPGAPPVGAPRGADWSGAGGPGLDWRLGSVQTCPPPHCTRELPAGAAPAGPRPTREPPRPNWRKGAARPRVGCRHRAGRRHRASRRHRAGRRRQHPHPTPHRRATSRPGPDAAPGGLP